MPRRTVDDGDALDQHVGARGADLLALEAARDGDLGDVGEVGDVVLGRLALERARRDQQRLARKIPS